MIVWDLVDLMYDIKVKTLELTREIAILGKQADALQAKIEEMGVDKEQLHIPSCDEYHAHSPDRGCCSSLCWCQQEIIVKKKRQHKEKDAQEESKQENTKEDVQALRPTAE